MYTSIFEESTSWRRAKSYIFIFTAVSDFYILLENKFDYSQTSFVLKISSKIYYKIVVNIELKLTKSTSLN